MILTEDEQKEHERQHEFEEWYCMCDDAALKELEKKGTEFYGKNR